MLIVRHGRDADSPLIWWLDFVEICDAMISCYCDSMSRDCVDCLYLSDYLCRVSWPSAVWRVAVSSVLGSAPTMYSDSIRFPIHSRELCPPAVNCWIQSNTTIDAFSLTLYYFSLLEKKRKNWPKKREKKRNVTVSIVWSHPIWLGKQKA